MDYGICSLCSTWFINKVSSKINLEQMLSLVEVLNITRIGDGSVKKLWEGEMVVWEWETWVLYSDFYDLNES